ncbi:MAG: DNA cytosine methyltransferase [Thermomicrobiales bacterium]
MRIVSLFSGAGGLDLGLEQAGHQVIWANDNDADAVATYKRNLGDQILLGPIESVPSDVIPTADVIVGGFPCQGFSQANLRREVEDDRNLLYKHFVRGLRTTKPKYFIAENVRGILSLGGGAVLERILADFRRLGYHVEHHLLNAADYGVPQSRLRVLFLGTRREIPERQRLTLPKPTHARKDRLSNSVAPWRTIGEALADIPEPDTEHSLLNHVCSKYKVTNRNFTGHRRTDGSKPSPTILARGNGGGGVCAIPHPKNHRRLTVRESAIVQSFPIDFVFCGGLNSMYRQVGNAVPVELARHLGIALNRASEG